MSHSDRYTGTVVHWRDTGFGFVREDGTGFKVYVHVTRLRDNRRYTDLPVGTRLEYARQDEPKGLAALDAVVLALGEVRSMMNAPSASIGRST
jgi:cold shock CspA family protein